MLPPHSFRGKLTYRPRMFITMPANGRRVPQRPAAQPSTLSLSVAVSATTLDTHRLSAVGSGTGTLSYCRQAAKGTDGRLITSTASSNMMYPGPGDRSKSQRTAMAAGSRPMPVDPVDSEEIPRVQVAVTQGCSNLV